MSVQLAYSLMAAQDRLQQGKAGWDRAGQDKAGQDRVGQGMAGRQGRKTGQCADFGLLLSLHLVPIHLLLQITLGILVDLDQINLLVRGVLSLSLELVEQVSLPNEVICLLVLPIHRSLQTVNLPLKMRHLPSAIVHMKNDITCTGTQDCFTLCSI